jgi:hypothetical protein
MSKVKYVPTIPADPPPPASTVSQWSFGIAMFAAFVIPFVLLVTSARYRLFADQAFLKLRGNATKPQEARRVSEGELGTRPAMQRQLP